MDKEANVSMTVYNFAPQSGRVTARFMDRTLRTKRAFKYWGGIWGAGIGCIFIPVMHFVLVPTALILGPVMFFKKLNEKDLILEGTGVCPKCKAFVSVPEQTLDWPLQQNCAECSALIVIEQAN